jgi:hypothetical protein
MRMDRFRRTLFALVAASLAAAPALAAAPEAPAPAEPPAAGPPAPSVDDADLGPQITITRNDRETIEEARVNGMLVWIKVTPRHGRPYYLVPGAAPNTFIRRDSLDSGLRVPMWVLFTW